MWLDGGWAVDALLGKQTRRHEDLDIVIERSNVETLVEELRRVGYRDVPRDDTAPWNFVLGDQGGHEIDFHVIELDEAGNGRYRPQQTNVEYTADALRGVGAIHEIPIPCIAADW